MVDPVLSPAGYVFGVGWLLAVGGSASIAAVAVRRTWLTNLPSLPGAVAVSVLTLAQITLAAQLMAAVGLLRPVPLLAIIVVASAAVILAAQRSDASPTCVPEAIRPPAIERWMATVAVTAVGAQWVAHTADALSRGMTHADTLWYHGPYSARFLQMGSLGDLGTLGYEQSRFFPLGSELLHAVAALPFHRDLLSPVLNLLFAALALAAAAAIGVRWGAASLSVLATAMVLGLPTLAGTQPGQASNDVVAVALLLSAVALYIHAENRRLPMGVAGLALGLAVGTKVTVVALAGPLALFVVVGALRRGHRTAATWWAMGAVLTAGCWAVRNVVLTGTPIPFITLSIGPWHHTGIAAPSGTPSIARSLRNGTSAAYEAGLTRGFGPLWLLVLAVALAGTAGLVHGPREMRTPACAGVIGAVAYLFTPYTGELSFQFNLRYLTPAVVILVVVAAVACAPHRRTRRLVAGSVTLVLAANLFADHHERVPAWPGSPLVGLVTAALILTAALAVGRPSWERHRSTLASVAVVVIILGGWTVQEHYLLNRYVGAGLHDDDLNAVLVGISGARVEVFGTPETYPAFGTDLSNRVHNRSSELYLDAPVPVDPCRHWRNELRGADIVATSSFGFAMRRFTPAERRWIFERDPAITTVYADDERAVYRIDGVLDPEAC